MVACIQQESMNKLKDVIQLRVRYSETDQMGTFYNSRALEWFECGRTELMRNRLGMSYAALEEKGVFLPRSEERRVGKECRIGCRSRWSPYH